jgi:hypothetical protein
MLEGIGRKPEPHCDRHSGGWRVVASAWALVFLLFVLFAGAEAWASHHAAAPRHTELAGVVIPRHDPASAVVGIPCAAPLEECGKSATALVPGLHYAYPLW